MQPGAAHLQQAEPPAAAQQLARLVAEACGGQHLEGVLLAGVRALDLLAASYCAEYQEGSGESPGPAGNLGSGGSGGGQPAPPRGPAAAAAPPAAAAPASATAFPPSLPPPPSPRLLLQLHLLLAALLPRLQQLQPHGCLLGLCLFSSRLQPNLLKVALELAWNSTPVVQRPQMYLHLLQHCSSAAAVGAMCAAFEPLLRMLERQGGAAA